MAPEWPPADRAQSAPESRGSRLEALRSTAVIALQGLPRGHVVSVVWHGDRDDIASFQDGTRCWVSGISQGRVVVEKQ